MEISVQDATMEMDASLKEYQAALDAQFEERKAMILSQEEKDLAVEVEAVKRQGCLLYTSSRHFLLLSILLWLFCSG